MTTQDTATSRWPQSLKPGDVLYSIQNLDTGDYEYLIFSSVDKGAVFTRNNGSWWKIGPEAVDDWDDPKYSTEFVDVDFIDEFDRLDQEHALDRTKVVPPTEDTAVTETQQPSVEEPPTAGTEESVATTEEESAPVQEQAELPADSQPSQADAPAAAPDQAPVDSPAQTEDSASAGSCPPATSDIALNLKNRARAIEVAEYGPMNPKEANDSFWQDKADQWSVTPDEAKKSLCGNCVFFVITTAMRDCIASGLEQGDSSKQNAWDAIDAAQLGYCEAFDFKCAASRTCNAWAVGGPITDETSASKGEE